MWSIGCTLYEMYTGKILFAGDSNNQMLRAMMEIRGKIGNKLYRRGELWRLHFDDLGNFVSQERDKVLGKVRRSTSSSYLDMHAHLSICTVPHPLTVIHLAMFFVYLFS